MQKTAQIIFFPVQFFPTFLEMERLKNLQIEIEFCQKQIEHDANGDKFEILLRKQWLANKLRESFHIVQ